MKIPFEKAVDNMLRTLSSLSNTAEQADKRAGHGGPGLFSQSSPYGAALNSLGLVSGACMRALENSFNNKAASETSTAPTAKR